MEYGHARTGEENWKKGPVERLDRKTELSRTKISGWITSETDDLYLGSEPPKTCTGARTLLGAPAPVRILSPSPTPALLAESW